MYIKIKDVLILIYNIISKRLFKNISNIFNVYNYLRNIIIILIENKINLKKQRKV
jgi:GTPase SAR1 family protein